MTDFIFDKNKIKKALIAYCNKVNELYKAGNVESSYNKPIMDLISLFGCKPEDFSGGRSAEAGENVDIKLWHLEEDINDIPAFGAVEVKKVNGIDDRANKQILIEANKYGNVILTDNVSWRFYQKGETTMYNGFALLKKDENNNFILDEEKIDLFIQSIKDYLLSEPTNIKSSNKLAFYMAEHARTIKVIIDGILKTDYTKPMFSELNALFAKLREELLPDLTIEKFADMYAQTITYGLFIARYNDKSLTTFSRGEALENLSKESVLLKKFFMHITTSDSLHPTLNKSVEKLCNLFSIADLQALLNQYEKKDPVVHFYEDFLSYYDKEIRKELGTYYTPVQVVRYMVNKVDDILVNEFKLERGFANNGTFDIKVESNPYKEGKKWKTEKIITVPQVAILDPACGTGTFMAEIIKLVKEKYFSGGNAVFYKKWIEDKNSLTSRLIGFEIMMTSYVVAHLKLRRVIQDTLGEIPNDSIKTNIYLTNTLAKPKSVVETNMQQSFFDFSGAINEEAEQADKWKARRPIRVIIGNPPYLYSSKNEYDVSSYHCEVDGVTRLKEKNPKGLNDDYVKFIRFSEQHIEKDGKGVFSFISNNGYLDNPTFRGMRASLLRTFDKIYILNLHGNSIKKETAPDGGKDENVFDIRVGVSIIFAIKTSKNNAWGKVYYQDLYGLREDKFAKLQKGEFEFKEVKLDSKTAVFIPQDEMGKDEYNKGVSLEELFTLTSTGIDTGNDDVTINEEREKIEKKINDIKFATNDEQIMQIMGKMCSGQTPSRVRQDILNSNGVIAPIAYRPFDGRYTYYSGMSCGWLSRPRDKKIMKSIINLEENISLVWQKQGSKVWTDVFVSDKITDSHLIGGKSYLAPLYIEREDIIEDKSSNLNVSAISKLSNNLSRESTSLEIFEYCYGILNSQAYREKYNEFLRADTPKVPVPASQEEFDKFAIAGQRLIELHLMKANVSKELCVESNDTQNLMIEQVKYQDGKVYINKATAICGITEEVWNYFIGGYQIVDKCLKTHKGEDLDYDKFSHLKKIVAIVEETIIIQKSL